MAIKYLKKAIKTPSTDDNKTRAVVQSTLDDIEKRKEEAIKELNKKFDKYEGEVIVSKEKIEEAIKSLHDFIGFTGKNLGFILKSIFKYSFHLCNSLNLFF